MPGVVNHAPLLPDIFNTAMRPFPHNIAMATNIIKKQRWPKTKPRGLSI